MPTSPRPQLFYRVYSHPGLAPCGVCYLLEYQDLHQAIHTPNQLNFHVGTGPLLLDFSDGHCRLCAATVLSEPDTVPFHQAQEEDGLASAEHIKLSEVHQQLGFDFIRSVSLQ